MPIKARPKSAAIEAMLTAVTGKNRVDCIERGECTTCEVTGLTEASFDSVLGIEEYCISGMCQACQDATFPEDPFDISRDYATD